MISVPLTVVMLFAGQVDIRSATNCPSAEAIAGKLIPLLPGTATASPTDGSDFADVQVLEIHRDGTSDLQLRLLDPSSGVIGQRRVSLRGTCMDMAEAVAAIFAAWKTNPSPSISERVPPVATARHASTPPAMPNTQSARFEAMLGAGVGVAFVGGTAASGNLEFRFGLAASPLQFRLGFAAETVRQLEVLVGQAPDQLTGLVDWQHTSISLGLAWRWLHPVWLFSLDGGPVFGWATLVGRGFTSNRSERSFDYGAAVGLRLARKIGRFSLWIEARPTYWAKIQQASVTSSDGTNVSKDVPQVDVAASLGISVSFFP